VLDLVVKTYDEMVEIAAMLASDDGENVEYDRGMAELIADSVGAIEGMPLDERAPQVLADIRERQAALGLT